MLNMYTVIKASKLTELKDDMDKFTIIVRDIYTIFK